MEIVHEVLEELATILESNLVRGNPQETVSKLIDCYCDFFSRKRDLFVVFQRAAFDLLSHEEACKYFQEIVRKLHDLRKRVAEKIGEITTRTGRRVSGDTLLRVVTSSIGGYCMEEIREGRTVTEEDREFLKEVFTAFLA